MTPNWEGHVYNHTGPIAAYERFHEADPQGKPDVFHFTCSHALDKDTGFSVDGISLKSEGWVTLSGQVRLIIARRW